MTGSLLQIVSTDIKDAFLTIDPQITFFKIVYLRHTPFSIDLLEETFNTIPNFGEEGVCELSKNGDLISNIFLKVELPSVSNLYNTDDNNLIRRYYDEKISYDGYSSMTALDLLNNYDTLVSKFTKFSSASMYYWRELNIILKKTTVNYTQIISYVNLALKSETSIQETYNQNLFTNVKIPNTKLYFNFDLLNYIKDNFELYKNSIYSSSETIEYVNQISIYLYNYIFYQNIYLRNSIANQDLFTNIINKESTSKYYFAWVSKIAFALINYIEIEIGGQEIDRVTSDILNNWYELSTSIEKINILDTMIGNINILTSYDDAEKPSYKLFIPIPFWFCKYKSQALPCVGLRHNDIIIKMKFNELYKCCYFEPDEKKEYSSNININDIIKINNVSLLVEYIHLGEDERKKFGSFTTETLIEQHKILEFNNITSNILLPLDFVNPVRELIWTIQKSSYINDLKLWNNFDTNNIFRAIINTITNDGDITINLESNYFSSTIINPNDYLDGYVEIFHSKYYNGIYKIINVYNNIIIINNNLYIYPDNIKIKLFKQNMLVDDYIIDETIQIYGNDLVSKRDSLYFTNVQSYQKHTNIPKNIHNYSFSLNTELFQPTGTLNFSIIDSKNLYINFDNNTLLQINNNDSFVIKIIGRSHNLLYIENGMAKLKFGI
jgi:hypothetical protein